jgi:putative two-component system response regulator
MLTVEIDIANAIRALTAGAFGYLVKPVGRLALLLQVGNAIEELRLTIGKRQYIQGIENKVLEQTRIIRTADEDMIHRLVKESLCRDADVGVHVNRIGWHSGLLADAIGWGSVRVQQIRQAAPMHDAGKIGIPDAILCKPGTGVDGSHHPASRPWNAF